MDKKDIIIDLEEKVKRLISLYDKANEKLGGLENEKNELAEKLKKKEVELENIKQKYSNLKLAKSVQVSSDDSHDAKININRLVREIDNCIALLNR